MSIAIEHFIDELVAAGASRKDVERQMRPVELMAVQSIAESQRDQLLLNLEYRSADLAERFGVDERTIRNWRKSAIDRKFASGMDSAQVA
ncbi:helix-turn-helix domain-containing protein [Luteimonas sp. RIT-PG2_3]